MSSRRVDGGQPAPGGGRAFEATAEQALAIKAPEMPVRIIAGAGSGKTTVMAQRVGALIDRGRRPDQVLGLTFSNKAAENLRERIAREVGRGIEVHVMTYHGFGASLVDERAEHLGFDRRPQLIDRASAFQLLYRSLDELVLEKRKVGRVANLAQAALRLASQCSDHLVSVAALIADCDQIIDDETVVDRVRETARGRRDLARMVLVYERAKRARARIDFGDQIALACEAVEADPAFARELLARFPVVLLDEYQDTNFAQRRLLQWIYPPGSAVTAVGDDMQSIYGFRGSHLRNLLDFGDHFGSGSVVPGIVEAKLTENFRSGPDIVTVANAVQATVATALPKDLRAAPTNAAATVESRVCADEFDEAEQIAEWIEARGAPWSDTLVLGRKRKIFGLLWERLNARGIPVEIIGNGGLLIRPEIVDVVAWLEVLVLDDPDVASLRLLRSPLRSIGFRDLGALARRARRLARLREPDERHPPVRLLDALGDLDAVADLSPEAWRRLKQLDTDRSRLNIALLTRSLVDLIEEVIDVEALRDRGDTTLTENLLRFLGLAAAFEPLDTPEPSTTTAIVRSFLEYLQLIRDGEDEPAEAVAGDIDAVRIMTIHQAKGLEYEHVVVAGLTGTTKSSIFPDERMPENGASQTDVLPRWLREDHDGFDAPPTTKARFDEFQRFARESRDAEERRLLYVALTRAKTRLLCTAAHWYEGPATPQGPSAFYDLIAAQTVVTERLPRPLASTENPAFARKERLRAAVDQASLRAPVRSAATGSTTQRGGNRERPATSRTRPGLVSTPLFDSHSGPFTGREGAPVDGSPRLSARVPHDLPVSALVSFARCPRQFWWTSVELLPRRPSAAAARGDRVHALIEAKLGPVAIDADSPSDDDVEPPREPDRHDRSDRPGESSTADASSGSMLTPPSDDAAFVDAFNRSPWASMSAASIETSFELQVGTIRVHGRVDARFDSGNRVHIVDWKTGGEPDPSDASASLQLDLYGLAAVEQWGVAERDLSTSYVYLRPDRPAGTAEVTKHWHAGRARQVRSAVEDLVQLLVAETRTPRPGGWCRGCDFASFCPSGPDTPAGRAAAASNPAVAPPPQ